MPAVAPFGAQPDRSKRQIQIVVDNEESIERYLVPAHELVDRDTTLVHERLRLRKDNPHAIEAGFDDVCLESGSRRTLGKSPLQTLNGHEPGVVTRAFVAAARVAEPNDEPDLSIPLIQCSPILLTTTE